MKSVLTYSCVIENEPFKNPDLTTFHFISDRKLWEQSDWCWVERGFNLAPETVFKGAFT